MALTGETLQVYPQTSQWQFSVSYDGSSGTRVYLDTDKVLTATKVPLPNIGDAWDTNNPSLTLKSITTTYIRDNPNCGRLFTCSYDGVPITQSSVLIGEDDLPKSVSIGGENWAWEPKEDTFTWRSSGDPVRKQMISKRVVLGNITIQGVVRDFDEYLGLVMEIAGGFNEQKFRGLPIGTVLFQGADFTEFRNRTNQKRWRVALNFVVRKCTGNFTDMKDGWNFILNESTGEWDEPLDPAGNVMLLNVDFTPLFSGLYSDEEETLYTAFPNQ
jgi:hypothetical protein